MDGCQYGVKLKNWLETVLIQTVNCLEPAGEVGVAFLSFTLDIHGMTVWTPALKTLCAFQVLPSSCHGQSAPDVPIPVQ